MLEGAEVAGPRQFEKRRRRVEGLPAGRFLEDAAERRERL